MNFEVRVEQRGRPELTVATAAAKQRTGNTDALIVMMLTLACTALSIFDLFLLATGN
jgi:hypothetical protein